MASSLQAILQKLEMDTGLSFYSEYTPPANYQQLPVVLYNNSQPIEDNTYGGGSGIFRYQIQFRVVSPMALQVQGGYDLIASSINNYTSGEPGWMTTQAETAPIVYDDDKEIYEGYTTYNVLSNLPENQANLVEGLISSSAQFGTDDDFVMGNLEVAYNSQLGDAVARSVIITGNLFVSGSVTANITASAANYAATASYLLGSIESASYAIKAKNADTASYFTGTIVSASYADKTTLADTASYYNGSVVSASYADKATLADTASYYDFENTNIFSSSAQVSFPSTSSFATSASYSQTASFARTTNLIEYRASASSVVVTRSYNPANGSMFSIRDAGSPIITTHREMYVSQSVNELHLIVQQSGSLPTAQMGTSSISIGRDVIRVSTTNGAIHVSGSTLFTDTMLGTASWSENSLTSNSASYVDYTNVDNKPTLIDSSSYAEFAKNAATASRVEFADVANKPTLVSSSAQLSIDWATNASSSISASHATYSQNSATASLAITASYAINGGGGGSTAASVDLADIWMYGGV